MRVDVCLYIETRLKQIEVELKWYQLLFTFQSTQHISSCNINKVEVPELKVQLQQHFINRQFTMMMGTWELILQFSASFLFPQFTSINALCVLFTASICLVPCFHVFSLFATSLLFFSPSFNFFSWFLTYVFSYNPNFLSLILSLTNYYLNYSKVRESIVSFTMNFWVTD